MRRSAQTCTEDCRVGDCECEEDASALEEMKQVADEAEKNLHTVLTASSFKGNSRECSGNASEGHGAAVLTYKHTNKQFSTLRKCSLNTAIDDRHLSDVYGTYKGQIQINNIYLSHYGNMQFVANHAPH